MRHVFAKSIGPVALLLTAALLAGCANSASGNGDPGARPLPPGSSCQSLKAEMDRLLGRGVSSSIESRQAGRKLSPQQSADADRYNEVLNYYLGGRCHA